MFNDNDNKNMPMDNSMGEQNINKQAKQGLNAPELDNKKASEVDFEASKEKGRVEDLFAETEGEVGGQEKKPEIFQPKEKNLEIEAEREEASLAKPASSTGTKKKIFILAGLAVGLLAIGGGGFLVFYSYSRSIEEDKAEKIIAPVQTEIEEKAEIESENQKEDTTSASKPPEVSPDLTLDSDNDGLTDEEERALGMNINSVDSDSDGLFDRIEVKVYKTDPLNSDTDGDGFLDGEEVKDGYNPKGEGKLYELK